MAEMAITKVYNLTGLSQDEKAGWCVRRDVNGLAVWRTEETP